MVPTVVQNVVGSGAAAGLPRNCDRPRLASGRDNDNAVHVEIE
jgi:hypothetical protein